MLPHMDWSLLACGARGHVTYAPDEPALRERLHMASPEPGGWRCLRCGTFVLGPPATTGPAQRAPRVPRGKEVRSAFILRVFAVERFLRAIVFGLLAYGVWRFATSRTSIERAFNRELPVWRTFLRQLGFNVDHSKLLGFIQHAFTLNTHTLTLLAIGVTGYTLIEIVEGIGLWLLKRWGEYFAMVATSVFLPYEVYDLTAKITVLRVLAFVINLGLVVYLVLTKRLFGARGGRKAYEARLRSESLLQAAELDALAASSAASPAIAGTPGQSVTAPLPPPSPSLATAPPAPTAPQLGVGSPEHPLAPDGATAQTASARPEVPPPAESRPEPD
jgi:uncharacterized membrane protein (DUF2068 family)